jgi:4-hydroxybutyrate CoA-transferase
MQVTTVDQALAALPRTGRVFLGPGCGLPVVLADALGEHAATFRGLTVYSSLVFEPAGFLDAEPECLRLVTLQPTGPVEKLVADGRMEYLPLRYSEVPDQFLHSGPLPLDALVVQVSPPDERGYCSLGVSTGMTAPLVRDAPLVIAELNPRMPRTFGAGTVHVRDIDLAVAVDHPLAPLKAARVGDAERTIGRLVAGLIPDRATVQVGIGAVPQAILESLAGHRDLGIHSGMLCDGMVPLVESGAVTGAYKSLDPFHLTAGEALGTEALFEFVDGNPTVRMLAAAQSHGLAYLQHQAGFVSVNSALEVDLTGQVNAEWLNGRQVSGLGGAFDFTEVTLHAPGARSIVALTATAARGTVSRIVPRLAAGTAVTTPRHCVQFVVTEFGVADLRARTLRERAAALVEVADPRFRDELRAAAGLAG